MSVDLGAITSALNSVQNQAMADKAQQIRTTEPIKNETQVIMGS
jgi:hypothetical protein